VATILVSELANGDLLDVWIYVAGDSEQAADRLIDEFARVFDQLAENPALGRLRDDLGSPLRSFPVKTYLVFYRPVHDGIEIARVLSGYRDLAELI